VIVIIPVLETLGVAGVILNSLSLRVIAPGPLEDPPEDAAAFDAGAGVPLDDDEPQRRSRLRRGTG
jgi:hypothetical protein